MKQRNKKYLVGLRIQIDYEIPVSAPSEAQAIRKAKQRVINKGVKLSTRHFVKDMDNPIDLSF